MPLARFLGSAFVVVFVLAACGGGGGSDSPSSPAPSAARSLTLCGVPTGPSVLTGTVTRVHDGDTITVADAQGEEDVRLQGIDAPELAQPFGPASRDALAALVLGKPVRVGHAGRDNYGRLLGEVFTANCEFANRRQLTGGMAWFYQAYRCELPPAQRDDFALAQQQAQAARTGLWSQAKPQAPWVFRNGHDPEAPTCSDPRP